MRDMTKEEVKIFLMSGTKTGKLATVRENGRAHVVPVWFVLDGEDLLFNTWHSSAKAGNMQRDGRVALCVDNEKPPYDFVMLEGRVTFSEDLDEVKYWATRIAARYMGQDQAEAFGERNSVPGEWLVRLKIEKVIAKKEMAAW